jgi:hypothetical protein
VSTARSLNSCAIIAFNSRFEERGCVGDQRQRIDRPEPLEFLNVLWLVEDDTTALQGKMRIAG